MSRKRYISTDVSVDKKLNSVSDTAALLHSWMIPHAKDDAHLTAKDPEEIKLTIIPGRKNSIAEVEAALAELLAADLLRREPNGQYYFPPDSFYKYQSFIGLKMRWREPAGTSGDQRRTAGTSGDQRRTAGTSGEQRGTPELAGEQRGTPELAGEQRGTPENGGSSSSSSSVSSLSSAKNALLSRARESMGKDDDDLGLGDKHPGNIAGWEIWRMFEQNCIEKGKRLPFYTLQLMGVDLMKWQAEGSDPRAVVEKAIKAGWTQLFDLSPRDKGPPQGQDDGATLGRISAIANGS